MDNQMIVPLINRIIKKHYGRELEMIETDGEYKKFVIPDMVDDDGEFTELFHKNYWGRLWVYDYEIVNKMKSILGLDDVMLKLFLKHYFEKKYGVNIKEVSLPDYDDFFDS
jgi:hypothetical protein